MKEIIERKLKELNLYDELNNIINEIPEEVKDCFVIYINKAKANELLKEAQKFIDEKIEFPITYKDIPVAINQFDSTNLELIETPEKITKVYLYEKNKVDNYLKEYEKLCQKYNIGLCGCGCCVSPYLDYCHHDSKTLNTNYYQVLNGGRSIGKTFQTINMYEQKYNQLQSNWNSLREWINTRIQANIIRTGMRSEELLIVLDKMNELEGKDK